MDVNGTGPAVLEPEEQGPTMGPLMPEQNVDARVFVNAPQYHWHQGGSVDQEARVALEGLHRDTYQLAREMEGTMGRLDEGTVILRAQVAVVQECQQGMATNIG